MYLYKFLFRTVITALLLIFNNDNYKCFCAAQEEIISARVYNGHVVKSRSDVCYMVTVIGKIVGFGEWTCGGVIIDKRHVLTAAHCIFTNTIASNYRIITNHLRLHDKDKVVKEVSGFRRHEEYRVRAHYPGGKRRRMYNENDIAMVQVSEPFHLDENTCTRPILTDFGEYRGELCTVSGWGADDKSEVSEAIQQTELPILTPRECKERWPEINEPLAMCAGHGFWLNQPCQGDSGGPLVCSGKLAGLVSQGGLSCGVRDYVGLYTNLTTQYDWIMRHIKYL